MRRTITILPLLLLAVLVSATFAESGADPLVVPKDVQSVIAGRCTDCHGADTSEGDVRLDTLGKLNEGERLDLLNQAQAQLFFGLMPPDDADQPTKEERRLLADWVGSELRKHNAW